MEEDILYHAIGFNYMKLEGILKYGIVSTNYAKKNNIPYAKNYNFTLKEEDIKKNNLGNNINEMITKANNDNIYLVRKLYISDDKNSAYQMYVKRGVSLAVTGVPYISDINKEFIKRSDEVIVKDYIPRKNINAIMIPSEYLDLSIEEIPVLYGNIRNYNFIKENVVRFVEYLNGYDFEVDIDEIIYLLNDLKIALRSLLSLDSNSLEYKDAMDDYKDIINELNATLAYNANLCFKKYFNKEVTIGELVSFIAKKYGDIDLISFYSNKKRVR